MNGNQVPVNKHVLDIENPIVGILLPFKNLIETKAPLHPAMSLSPLDLIR
jgi:hypothetical protein